MIKLITNKKIPFYVVMIVLYIAACFGNMFAAQSAAFGILAYAGSFGIFIRREIYAGIAAVAIYGALYLGLFELVARAYFSLLRPFLKGFNKADALYYLRFFAILANIIVGLIKLLYFVLPLSFVLGETIISFLVFSGCYFWFFMYIRGKCLSFDASGVSLTILAAPYIAFNLFLTVVNLISGAAL